MLSKKRTWCHDLKIAYGVKGYVCGHFKIMTNLCHVNVVTFYILFIWGTCSFLHTYPCPDEKWTHSIQFYLPGSSLAGLHLLWWFHRLNWETVDSDQLASSEATWSGSTLCSEDIFRCSRTRVNNAFPIQLLYLWTQTSNVDLHFPCYFGTLITRILIQIFICHLEIKHNL